MRSRQENLLEASEAASWTTPCGAAAGTRETLPQKQSGRSEMVLKSGESTKTWIDLLENCLRISGLLVLEEGTPEFDPQHPHFKSQAL